MNVYGNNYGFNAAYGYGYQAAQPTQLTRVTGLEGAKAYQMSANSVAALFDAAEDVMYIKSTDGAGFPTIRVFEFVERKEVPVQTTQSGEFVSRKEFEELKQEVEKYGKQLIRKCGNEERHEHHADGQPIQTV